MQSLGFTGDPFVSCREFTKQDLYNPNPCGPGATCQPGKCFSNINLQIFKKQKS